MVQESVGCDRKTEAKRIPSPGGEGRVRGLLTQSPKEFPERHVAPSRCASTDPAPRVPYDLRCLIADPLDTMGAK